MAMREVIRSVLRLGYYSSPGRFHRSLGSSSVGELPAINTKPVLLGQKTTVEKRWQEFFSDPSQWWDYRLEKANARHPDFKHKKTQAPLWLDGRLSPPWVQAKLAVMAPEALHFEWNARLARFVKTGQYKKALELFHQMQQEGITLDGYTFVQVLNACASLQSLEEGRHIHGLIIQSVGESNVHVGSSLVDMYAKCGRIEDAWEVFNRMPTRNVVSWSAIILGHVKCGQGQKAMQLYQQMRQEGVEPNTVTFVGVLNACASIVALNEGRQIHEQIIQSGCESDVFVANSLVNMYSKCGSIQDAGRVFNKMPRHDVVSWNAMLGGYARHGHGKEALEHFEWMCQEGIKIDNVTFALLLSACSHSGLVDEGLCYFESMGLVYGISATVEHYTCMVDLFGRAGHLEEAEGLIKTPSCEPDSALEIALLGACRVHGDVEIGERIAKHFVELDCVKVSGYVVRSNMYAAAGKWDPSASVKSQDVEIGK